MRTARQCKAGQELAFVPKGTKGTGVPLIPVLKPAKLAGIANKRKGDGPPRIAG